MLWIINGFQFICLLAQLIVSDQNKKNTFFIANVMCMCTWFIIKEIQ
jgi:hypothetical protein